ncbi:1-acyl-sn-glycerol-3-phosphate acyltransferase epsilon-like [Sycon ciliatum]|uniref:1-acyl-sn-glycerol-3-phosphate acyltransferase epsilon-like n=1 Tax=Sycon ciliatum TaxID=27933 RepID=UPI0031F69D56
MAFTATHILAKFSWVPTAGAICASLPLSFTVAVAGGVVCTPAMYVSDSVSRRLRDAFCESGLNIFQQVVNLALGHFNNVEIVWHGERLPAEQENAIVVCNHQCTVDWMLVGMLASRQGCAQAVRFMLKDSLKYIPIVGYYLKLIGCVYVKRGTGDSSGIQRQLQYVVENQQPIWWVVYPEGTRYDNTKPRLIEASHQFSRERGLPLLQNVLVPKSKGFEVSVEALRGHCQAVYDITVVYTARNGRKTSSQRDPAPSMTDFAAGRCSRIDIHLSRIAMADIPQNPAVCRKWLLDRFIDKDRILTEYYEKRSGVLVDDPYHWPLSLRRSLLGALPGLLGVGLLFSETGRKISLSLLVGSSLVGCLGFLL